jgi:hypothetical protein
LKRRARGTGSLFFDPTRGVWVGRVPVGRHPQGRTLYREVSDPKQGECVRKMREAGPPDEGTTVAEFAAQWLAGLHVRPQTKDSYANSVTRRINPVLGHLKLTAVTTLQVEHAVRQWSDTYSVGTVLVTVSHLRGLFRAAVRAGVIATSPVGAARKPRASRVTLGNLFSPGELAAVIAAASRRPGGEIIAFLAATGCRKGEAIALDVTDFDRATGTVRIDKTVSHAHGIGPPKSVHSGRAEGGSAVPVRVPVAAGPVVDGRGELPVGAHAGPVRPDVPEPAHAASFRGDGAHRGGRADRRREPVPR